QRNLNLNGLALLDDDQVSVFDNLKHRVLLYVLHQHELLLTSNVELDERVCVANNQAEGVRLNREVQGSSAVAVNNNGGLANSAELACDALTESLTCVCDKLCSFGTHFVSYSGHTPIRGG